MLYNREPDLNYICGNACPSNISMKIKQIKNNNESKYTLYVANMNPNDNLDYFRIAYWQNKHNLNVEIFDETKIINIKKYLKNAILFFDYAKLHYEPFQFDKDVILLYVAIFDYVILPFQNIYQAFFLEPEKIYPNIQISFLSQEEHDMYLFDCYGSRCLNVNYSLIKITQTKKNVFIRFKDVWTEERIISDSTITDEQTLIWIQQYGKKKLSSKLISQIPHWKLKTLHFMTS